MSNKLLISTRDFVLDTCLKFYQLEEILEARQVICDSTSKTLPNRRGDDKNHKTLGWMDGWQDLLNSMQAQKTKG
jgi:hypothetical protein